MKNVYDLFAVGTSAVFATITFSNVDAILKFVSTICTVLILILTLVVKIIDFVKKAKADGKFDADEIKEGIDIVTSGVNEIKEQIEKNKEEK